MQIVIDIPEKNYTAIKKFNYCYETLDGLGEYIRKGTPLPKGHGDLIDRDKVIDLLNEQEYNYYTELDKVCDTVYEAPAVIGGDNANYLRKG